MPTEVLLGVQKAGPISLLQLSELDRRKRIEVRHAKAAKAAVLTAYEQLWDVGVLHRDVAPRNMIITRDAHGGFDVKLLDFGHSILFHGPVPLEQREVDLRSIDSIFR